MIKGFILILPIFLSASKHPFSYNKSDLP